jgi:hypothetical protein
MSKNDKTIYYHLPGLFEFYDLYHAFLPLFREHRDYFYDWCEIGSIYGAPQECLWGGGRVGFGEERPENVLSLMNEYGISSRLTFSNSLLEEKHLLDKNCNRLCEMFEQPVAVNYEGEKNGIDNKQIINSVTEKIRVEKIGVEKREAEENRTVRNGIILHSDLLLEYIKKKYPGYYFVSSTTKVMTDFDEFEKELNREEFSFVVPDFRLNKDLNKLSKLSDHQKQKVEFLCNECCWFECNARKQCYENVSKKNLDWDCEDHICVSPTASRGYRFSDAMNNPGFIGIEDIQNIYAPEGFMNFKIEGRSLGSAMILEFLLYYMTKPEHQLKVREEIYLSSSLDLF